MTTRTEKVKDITAQARNEFRVAMIPGMTWKVWRAAEWTPGGLGQTLVTEQNWPDFGFEIGRTKGLEIAVFALHSSSDQKWPSNRGLFFE